MSLNCEPTELTPLRRSNCSRRQQEQQHQQEHYTPEHIENIDDDDDGRCDRDIHNHELYLGGNSSSQHGTTESASASASVSVLALGHLQSPAFSEYMSINNNNNNHPVVGSDSSRADTSEPNSQQALNPKAYIMSDTKRIITRVSIDFVILLAGESFIYLFNFISFFFLLVCLFHLCITSNKIIVDRMYTCPFFSSRHEM